eukprot:1153097-Pelagomonas_calceolata.AAC.2
MRWSRGAVLFELICKPLPETFKEAAVKLYLENKYDKPLCQQHLVPPGVGQVSHLLLYAAKRTP